MEKCVTNKKIYHTQEIADDVLIETRTRFDFNQTTGPVAVYRCDDCGYYHLTSQGPMNEKLQRYLESGQLNRDKQARQWLDKIKRKGK